MGKPPEDSKPSALITVEMEESDASDLGLSESEQQDSSKIAEVEADINGVAADDPVTVVEEEEHDVVEKMSPRTRGGFIIEIPDIPNKDEYQHLPGHFEVSRVLSEYSASRYLVKLRSGERDIVSVCLWCRSIIDFPFNPLSLRPTDLSLLSSKLVSTTSSSSETQQFLFISDRWHL